MSYRYHPYVVINAQTGAAVHWTAKRRWAEDKARYLTRIQGGTYLIAKVVSVTEVHIVENRMP